MNLQNETSGYGWLWQIKLWCFASWGAEVDPVMEDFSITVASILKLLQNLKPGKAAGPDRLKPLLLKELREEIAPIMQVII